MTLLAGLNTVDMRMNNLVECYNELARPSENNYFDEMVEQYGRVRQLLPSLLQKISFKAAPAGQAILATLAVCRTFTKKIVFYHRLPTSRIYFIVFYTNIKRINYY